MPINVGMKFTLDSNKPRSQFKVLSQFKVAPTTPNQPAAPTRFGLRNLGRAPGVHANKPAKKPGCGCGG